MGIIEIISKWGLEKLGRFYSIYEGYVVNVEDPEKMGRIQVVVPRTHFSNTTPVWARQKGIPSGNGCSVHILPQKGEMVWVEFLGGNPRLPVWSFGHHNENQEYPEEFVNNSDVYGLKTKTCTLTIDDNNKSLEVKSGDFLMSITNNGKDVEIKNKSGFKIELNEAGLKMGKGDLHEPMLLGTKTQTVINADIANLQALVAALAAFASTGNSICVPPNVPLIPLQAVFAALNAACGALIAPIQTNMTNATTIKSNHTKTS